MKNITIATAWRIKKHWVMLISIVLLSSCQNKNVQPDFSGRLDILGPRPSFNLGALSPDWVKSGDTGTEYLRLSNNDGVPALKISSGEKYTLLARRISANLLATPYLSWAWNIQPNTGDQFPIRIIIGLGNEQSNLSLFPDKNLPEHQRLITLSWGRSALQRGTLSPMNDQTTVKKTANYTVRGGEENTGSWWMETVDLSEVYDKSWPGEEMRDVKIVFIGIAATARPVKSSLLLSGLRLSR